MAIEARFSLILHFKYSNAVICRIAPSKATYHVIKTIIPNKSADLYYKQKNISNYYIALYNKIFFKYNLL